MPRGKYDRSKMRKPMPTNDTEVGLSPPEIDPPADYEALRARLAEAEALLAQRDDDGPMPNLIRPVNRTPSIDLTRPEDAPDQPDGEWSRRHLLQFLERQPYDMVYVPKEAWEPEGEDCYVTVGYQGHWFSVKKEETAQVPIQIATIIKQSRDPFPTFQSQARRRALTDLNKLPQQSLGRRGVVEGVEVSV